MMTKTLENVLTLMCQLKACSSVIYHLQMGDVGQPLHTIQYYILLTVSQLHNKFSFCSNAKIQTVKHKKHFITKFIFAASTS